MNDSKRIDIAKNFVVLHRRGKNAFSTKFQNPARSEDQAYLEIYYNLIGGVYGNLEQYGDGEITVEIGSCYSYTRNPILFDFEDLENYWGDMGGNNVY